MYSAFEVFASVDGKTFDIPGEKFLNMYFVQEIINTITFPVYFLSLDLSAGS
jgi:hypothetical protein